MCQPNDATTCTNLHYFCAGAFLCAGSMCEPKNRGCIQKYPHRVFCCLLHRLDPEIMRDASFLSFLLIICCFVPCTSAPVFFLCYKKKKSRKKKEKTKTHREKSPIDEFTSASPQILQATGGRSCTLNKNCHPGQLAAMKHLFCLAFPGTRNYFLHA